MVGAKQLIEMNVGQAELFVRNRPKRVAWREDWPLEVAAFECTDGRSNFATVLTGVPRGVIQTWKNPGGCFNIAKWIRFQNSVKKQYGCARMNDRLMLFVAISHYSRSSEHLGCAAHG